MKDVEEPPAQKTHKCPCCGCDVPDERIEIVGFLTCLKCTPQGQKKLGVMEYSEKAGGILIITESLEEFKMLKRPANQRR